MVPEIRMLLGPPEPGKTRNQKEYGSSLICDATHDIKTKYTSLYAKGHSARPEMF
jgi:hypothetical protein